MLNFTRKVKVVLLVVLSIVLTGPVFSQRQMENLKHGLVAVKTNSGVFLSWRVLANEMKDVAYNLYKDGSLLNTEPISDISNYLDASGTTSSVYQVRPVIKGVEKNTNESASVWATNYKDIPVRKINGGYGTYELNDASVGDLDGDGEYEIIVKRLALNMDISSTDYHYLEAYKMDGTFMWAVNMGPNIYNAVEFNFLVWDLDGDGKAEVALRTSEGFIDGVGNQMGDVDGDGKTNYRYSISSVGYRMEGPDYLSVLDGMTGEELARAEYIHRGPITDWGKDDGGHRSTKCMFTVAYQDGKTPSIVISRGIYERIAMASWKYSNGSLTQNWYFDSNSHPDYAGQGYHNLTQGDVDDDGRDEVMYGSMCMNDNGQGLYSTKLGHGDAQHLSDINPYRKGLEFFGCLENYAGGDYRDAGTGEILFYKNIGRDMGRAGCADITPDYPGMEMWGPSGFPFLSSTGDAITNLSPPGSMNFFIWWDGDLSREMLDHAWYDNYGIGTITKYNNGANTQLLRAEGTRSDNWTKGNPALSADVLGDWREEAIWRTADNSALRIYTTTYPTSVKIYTLMNDPQYRAAIGWQPNSYNQPPHPGFFIGNDMDSVPPAPIILPGQKVWKSGSWDAGTSASWTYNSADVNFADGDSVLFDISGDHSTAITVDGDVAPSDIRVISPDDYIFSGTGSITGNTDFTKAGRCKLTINTSNTYTGITRVWDGSLIVNGLLENSQVLVKRFATAGGNGTYNNGLKLEPYTNLVISDAKGATDTLFINKELSVAKETTLFWDLSNDVDGTTKTNDILVIDGDLNFSTTTININRLDGKLSAGDYVLATVSGSMNGNLSDITVTGIPGIPHSLSFDNNKLVLTVDATRAPGKVEWTGAVDSDWDVFNKLNWSNNGEADYFIGEDSVIINDNAKSQVAIINGNYAVSDLTIDINKTFLLSGTGSVAGNAGLTKRGAGTILIKTENSYTGPTKIEGGKVSVVNIANAGYASYIGASSSAASNLQLNGGALEITGGGEITTDRNVTVGVNNGEISVTNGTVTFGGYFTGPGNLIKNGKGTLILKTRNYHNATIIRQGTIRLTEDIANIDGLGDTVIFRNGGTLAMNDNSYSYTDGCRWNILVEEGQTGSLLLDSRSSLTGKLLGSGILNLYSPWIRNDLNGDWSGFTGKINITTDGDGGDFRINNTYGFGNADVNLNGQLYTYNLKGGTTRFGTLSGTSASTLSGNIWSVGHNDGNAVFNGLITGSAVIYKYGTGKWTLTNANDYTGSTYVNGGSLIVSNTSGSATGTGTVTVNNGAILLGTGSVKGSVTVNAGGYLQAGSGSSGSSLTVNNLVRFQPGSYFAVAVNNTTNNSDKLVSSSVVYLGGTLYVSNKGGAYKVGDSFKVIESTANTGDFDAVSPASPGTGLAWDLSKMRSDGILMVTVSNAIDENQTGLFEVYPNPGNGLFTVELANNEKIKQIQVTDLNGKTVYNEGADGGMKETLNLQSLASGIYMLKVETGDKVYNRRIAIK
ncbi:T9SS type A sorting domain-containing protein [Saccharicrinis sp. FJH62]|uniref:rhamnogalacturonan lyase family protein n=1 Tax=Saccharicrinis sp. FJH62 TaxID=3344657 RepID=UPI0035D484B4